MLAAFRGLVATLWLVIPLGSAAASSLTLGLVVPPSESDATSLLRGVQLAVEDASDTADQPVVLEVRSEDGQWGTVGNDAVVLVCNRHVDALITPSDGPASHLMLQVASRTRIPVATVCPDASVTDAGVPWVVRVVPRTDEEAVALFKATLQANHAPLRWSAVIPAGRSGRAARRDLETGARATAMPSIRFVELGDSQTDLCALAQTVAGDGSDGVLLWLPPARAGALVATLRDGGYSGKIAGPSKLDSPAFFSAAGTAAAGVLIATFEGGGVEGTRGERFTTLYRDRFAAAPDFSAAAAYDAAQVLIATLRHAGDGVGYREFPLAYPIAGVTGTLRFDEFGNRTEALEVLCCEQGRFERIPAASSEL